MDVSATDGDEPVTADELDELLKGLTSFGDIDYRLVIPGACELVLLSMCVSLWNYCCVTGESCRVDSPYTCAHDHLWRVSR